MSREIEFRGMICKGIVNAGSWVFWGISGTDILDVIDEDTVGQYTGLKDKNGTKIFEGDILSFGFWNGREEEGLCLHQVFFSSEFAAFRSREITNAPNNMEYPQIDHLCCEVIGNIHQNPELLETTS